MVLCNLPLHVLACRQPSQRRSQTLAFELALGQAAQPEVLAVGAFLSDAGEESSLIFWAVVLMSCGSTPRRSCALPSRTALILTLCGCCCCTNHGFGVEEGCPAGGLHHPG